jgi:hypothetical protein
VRGDRPESNRYREAHNLGCSPLTPRPPWSGDDRTRTGALSPDKRALCPAELRPRKRRWKAGSAPRNRRQRRCRLSRPRSQLLPIGAPASACPRRHLLTGRPWRLVEASCTLGPALCTGPCSVTSLARPSASQSVDLRRGCGLRPRPLTHVLEPARSRHAPAKPERTSRGDSCGDSAGGIRTHDLELMRLARTAAPLPRKSGRQDSNLRSPAPEAGGVANSPTARRRTSTPGGTRTRSFRVESPASSPFRPRGQESSGGRARTCALAINSRASCQLDHAGTKGAEGEGVEPPRPEDPPVFETGYRAGGSPSRRVAPAGFEPATLRLRGGSSAELSYGAEVWPAGIEPATPRVSDGRSTG